MKPVKLYQIDKAALIFLNIGEWRQVGRKRDFKGL